ncbi:MAG: MOSC domain-containing protein [Pseudomonadota bacterium]
MKVTDLYRYPVKGLSPERLDRVDLTAGETVPFDRIYAIENGPGRFDPMAPKHLPKINFLMLMRNGALAALETVFDVETHTLTVLRDGHQVARGNLSTSIGRQLIEQFLAAYLKSELRGPPKITFSEGHSFSDVKQKCLHIVNRASIQELERVTGRDIDPLRFRPNVVIEGAAPWEEFNWVDKSLRLGGLTLRVFDRTVRCAATEVDPTTGQRDLSVPSIISRTWNHTDFGIYAVVDASGSLQVGDDFVVE